MARCAGLFQPVEPVAVALAKDQVELAVVVYVVAKDGKACVFKAPIAMPGPLVGVRVYLLKPAMRGKHVRLAVAVDVGDADAVAVLRAVAKGVHLRLGAAEVNPDDAGVVVVRKGEVGLAVAVNVAERSTLCVIGVGDFFGFHCAPAAVAAAPGFLYQKRPFVIQPVVTRSGRPS